MLAAYIDGNSTENEKLLIESVMSEDSMLSEAFEIAKDSVSLLNDFDTNLLSFFESNEIDQQLNSEDMNMSHSKLFSIYGEDVQNQTSEFVRQTYPDTCAIKSQQLVLEKFGVHISEEELRQEAIEHGWYSPGKGTPMEDVGKLLELHGVDVHQYVNGNICNVINELAQGHEVIMGVDSGELWHYGIKEQIEDYIPGIGGADHALIVSGINTDDINNIKVIVTDPGTGDVCKEYSLSQFVDAANDSSFYMVTTDNAVPNIFDTFGEGIIHLPIIGDMTYDDFVRNFAYLHDVSERPVFEDFISRMSDSSTLSYFANDNSSNEANYYEENNNVEDDFDEDSDTDDDIEIDGDDFDF